MADTRRRVVREEAAAVDHPDARAERERFADVVGHKDHRHPQPLLHPGELLPHLSPCERIQRAERLVHQQDRRIDRQRARDADTLPLPA